MLTGVGREEFTLVAVQEQVNIVLTELARDLLTSVVKQEFEPRYSQLDGGAHRNFAGFELGKGMGEKVRLGVVRRSLHRLLEAEQAVAWGVRKLRCFGPIEELLEGSVLHMNAFLLWCNV